MSIHSTIDNFRRRRSTYAKRLHSLVDAATREGVETTGVRVYERMAEARWQIDAIDYVLRSFDADGETEEVFLVVIEGVQQDMISFASGAGVALRSEPPAYWKELGRIERDMRMEVAQIKHRVGA